MKTKIIFLLSSLATLCTLSSCSHPSCQGFTNYNDRTCIIFTEENHDKKYEVSEVTLFNDQQTYNATDIQTRFDNGVVNVTLTFPPIKHFVDAHITLRINDRKTSFNVCEE